MFISSGRLQNLERELRVAELTISRLKLDLAQAQAHCIKLQQRGVPMVSLKRVDAMICAHDTAIANNYRSIEQQQRTLALLLEYFSLVKVSVPATVETWELVPDE